MLVHVWIRKSNAMTDITHNQLEDTLSNRTFTKDVGAARMAVIGDHYDSLLIKRFDQLFISSINLNENYLHVHVNKLRYRIIQD